ncbi:hypothetical protein [Butyrivibrio fibrisolvens]|uniref:Lipoprotein n=1 Tax=Butyrivibrio fibrisolvens TaxID=831 RepID=A0A317G5A6_BUTFI|nr:hypothetical protein [Butyrivibrio fibrisolvens]PWT27650.1 hypothetical protein CPT75_11365 [Butyrivibrio fibrisolvens]
MKKRTLSIMLVVSLLCTGCGTTFNLSDVGNKSTKSIKEESMDLQNKSSNKEENISDNSNSSSDVSSIEVNENESSEAGSTNGNTDTDGIDRYEAFISNTEKVYFDEESDVLPYHLQRKFDNSEGYTLDEIIETSLNAYYDNDKSKGDPSIQKQYIDCGKDGVKELLVDIRYPGMENSEYEEFDDKYVDHWVIKEVDNQLVVKYFGTDSLRSYTCINEYGCVNILNIGAYLGVLPETFGYLDENANWVLYYRYYYYLDMSDFVREKGNLGLNLEYSSEEWKDMQVEEYLFDDEAGYTDSDKTGFTIYVKTDDNGVVEDDSIYGDSSEYKEFFDDAGINTCPRSEVEKRLEERREEIGLSEDVMG